MSPCCLLIWGDHWRWQTWTDRSLCLRAMGRESFCWVLYLIQHLLLRNLNLNLTFAFWVPNGCPSVLDCCWRLVANQPPANEAFFKEVTQRLAFCQWSDSIANIWWTKPLLSLKILPRLCTSDVSSMSCQIPFALHFLSIGHLPYLLQICSNKDTFGVAVADFDLYLPF